MQMKTTWYEPLPLMSEEIGGFGHVLFAAVKPPCQENERENYWIYQHNQDNPAILFSSPGEHVFINHRLF